MIAQITTTTEDLRAIDYTHAKVTNFYMVILDDNSTVLDESVTFDKLRRSVFQSLYTNDLLEEFNVSNKPADVPKHWKPHDFIGCSDGTDTKWSDFIDNAGLPIYMPSVDANRVMRDVFRALPMCKFAAFSIKIKLHDGRDVTINHNFPNTSRTSGWKAKYMDFARKFVMV